VEKSPIPTPHGIFRVPGLGAADEVNCPKSGELISGSLSPHPPSVDVQPGQRVTCFLKRILKK
jgi:hypothetical protein